MTDIEREKSIEDRIKDNLDIDETNLRQELMDQPTHAFYWGAMWARAARARRRLKLDIEQLEAVLSKQFREHMLKADPSARVTEKMIREFLDGHPKYQDAQSKMVQAGFMEDMFGVAKDAFKMKAQSLMELSKGEGEQKFYANEMKAMRQEYEVQEAKKQRRRRKEKVDEAKSETEIDIS